MHTTIFYGNLPKKNSNHNAGGQIGNSKTIKILNKHFKVTVLSRPYRINVFLLEYIAYFCNLFNVLIRLALILLTNRNVKIVHISGFYFNQIYFETILLLTAKLFKRKVIYELRAGGMQDAYINGSKIYKYFFNSCIKNANLILTQGLENKVLLKKISNTKIVYYPNFVSKEFLNINNTENYSQVNFKSIQLVYWGRISVDKNIDLIIKICKHLIDKDITCQLKIIGNVYNQEYFNNLKKLVKDLGIKNNVEFSPPIYDRLGLITKVKDSHFYLFPSSNSREGHSNSLTEAMALGIVPIASTIGFNRTVIDDNRLIIDSLQPEDYASRIIQIWKAKEWSDCSIKVRNRIRINYTEREIEQKLINSYQEFLF